MDKNLVNISIVNKKEVEKISFFFLLSAYFSISK